MASVASLSCQDSISVQQHTCEKCMLSLPLHFFCRKSLINWVLSFCVLCVIHHILRFEIYSLNEWVWIAYPSCNTASATNNFDWIDRFKTATNHWENIDYLSTWTTFWRIWFDLVAHIYSLFDCCCFFNTRCGEKADGGNVSMW